MFIPSAPIYTFVSRPRPAPPCPAVPCPLFLPPARQRCSSSLLGDELLQIFVTFVNSDAYGPTALADAFVEIEGRRRRTDGVGAAARVGLHIGVGVEGGNRSGDTVSAAPVATTKGPPPGQVEEPVTPGTATVATPGHGNGGGGGGGGVLLVSASRPFLSADRRTPEAAAAGLPARAAGRGGDDAMASLRRLIGLWLFFHEMVRSSSLAKVGLRGWFIAAAACNRPRTPLGVAPGPASGKPHATFAFAFRAFPAIFSALHAHLHHRSPVHPLVCHARIHRAIVGHIHMQLCLPCVIFSAQRKERTTPRSVLAFVRCSGRPWASWVS